MSFWDEVPSLQPVATRRRTEFGLVRRRNGSSSPVMYIPPWTGAKVGERVRYIEVEDGVAFRISATGDFKVRPTSPSSRVLCAQMPKLMERYAKDKVRNFEVEEFYDGWLIRFAQFAE